MNKHKNPSEEVIPKWQYNILLHIAWLELNVATSPSNFQ